MKKDDRHDWAADQCLRSNFGKIAVHEGWGWDLFCFVRDNGEWPKGGQIERLKGARLMGELALSKLPAESPFKAAMNGLYVALQSREEWIREKYG